MTWGGNALISKTHMAIQGTDVFLVFNRTNNGILNRTGFQDECRMRYNLARFKKNVYIGY